MIRIKLILNIVVLENVTVKREAMVFALINTTGHEASIGEENVLA